MTNHTEKELLELAAKAVGINLLYWVIREKSAGFVIDDYSADWNPLTDDGDALRLAVKLSLGISIVLASKRTDVVAFTDIWANAIEAHGDPYAATRRAIVRAAAAIGEKL